MKNKRLVILGLLVAFFSMGFVVEKARANVMGDFGVKVNFTKLWYKPNVPIPIEVQVPGGKLYNLANETEVDSDFLAAYIVGIYKYGAGFAGIVAMFMLVIAGWRWLFAAGNAQKISASKDMINGVLIGLALLFGGQLLLRQISSDFDSIQSLKIELPAAVTSAVNLSKAEELYCNGVEADGKTPNPKNKIEECGNYQDDIRCRKDVCNLVGPGNFDDTCLPLYSGKLGKDIKFVKCDDCNNRCSCKDYKTILDKNNDPCDCDEDGLGGSAIPETSLGCCTVGDTNNNGYCDDVDPDPETVTASPNTPITPPTSYSAGTTPGRSL